VISREGVVKEEKKDNLRRFNRWLAVPTVVLGILLAVSGYGIVNQGVVGELTGGLITHPLSLSMHLALIIPTLTLLTVHILIALRSALIRWGVKEGNLLNAFLILLGIFAVGLLVLMQYPVF
jgi:hypothetical protein